MQGVLQDLGKDNTSQGLKKFLDAAVVVFESEKKIWAGGEMHISMPGIKEIRQKGISDNSNVIKRLFDDRIKDPIFEMIKNLVEDLANNNQAQPKVSLWSIFLNACLTRFLDFVVDWRTIQ